MCGHKTKEYNTIIEIARQKYNTNFIFSKQRILNSIERSMSSKYNSYFIIKDFNYNQQNFVIRRKA